MAVITQRFVVSDTLMPKVRLAQATLEPFIAESQFVVRVSVSIPVEHNIMNELLIEVLKKMIFRNVVHTDIRLVSLSQQAPEESQVLWNVIVEPQGHTDTYTLVVYEMQVANIELCVLVQHSNDYAELTDTISELFAVDISIELRAVCLVTNVMRAEALTPSVSDQISRDDGYSRFCAQVL